MTNDQSSSARPGQVTRVLSAIREGDDHAADELLPIVYEELRELARCRLAGEPSGQTLQATALVHEAYLRLLGDREGSDSRWENRGHFFGAAALAMRRIMVERARKRRRRRHGGGRQRLNLNEAAVVSEDRPVDLIALDEALDRLEAHDGRKARVVMLRYFAGLTVEQAAEALGVSIGTVKNDWNYARAWLHRELAEPDDKSDEGAEA